MNRRQFMQTTAGAAALLALRAKAYGYAVSMPLRKFMDQLPIFGPAPAGVTSIPLATPDTTTYPGIDYYEIEAGVFRQQQHSMLPVGGTRLYGYRQLGGTHRALGAPILATKDKPVRIKFKSSLPAQHIIPFDASIPSPGNGGGRQDRSAIHLHGGLVPWTSDGGPFHWLANAANGGPVPDLVGASLVGTEWLPGPGGVGLTNDYFYPNHQSARFMWYHDHAIGTTRTSAYAGIATGYLVTDSVEATVTSALAIPIPGDVLVFQDKVFYDPAIDPGYANVAGPQVLGGAVAGDLWYPYIYDPNIWKLGKSVLPLPIPSCVAEMFGDTMLVNGVAYPFQFVSGVKRYRLLNACNARFLNLSFAVEDILNPGEPLLNNKKLPVLAPVSVWQIATEGGFLPTPVQLVNSGVAIAPLLLGPAERADLIVDFSQVPTGTNVILYNDAPAPFPGGSALFDYSFGTKGVAPGFSPNTRTPMMFRVTAGGGLPYTLPAGYTIPVSVLPTVADPVNGGLKLNITPGGTHVIDGITYTYLDPAVAGNTQEITLNEAFDSYGRLAQLVGNVNNAAGLFGSPYWDGPGERVKYRTIQIWNVYNLTADAHPMHVHLFNAMILRRQPIKVNKFNGMPTFAGPGLPPDANELGWKETFKMYPGTCTTIAVLVEDPFVLPNPGSGVLGSNSVTRTYTINTTAGPITTGALPTSPRLLGFGVTGDEYVWHCHILEHEEHDMMHSLVAGNV